jgi:aminoglycoside phosphotransferase (APT) family kinase protein
MFRLGDDLAVRLPRMAPCAGDLDREREWLPRLRGRLTLGVPEPVAYGEPTQEHPLPWAVYRWLDGEQYDDALVPDESTAAADLALFVCELRAGPIDGAPATGRSPLAELDAATRTAIGEAADLLDVAAVTAAWDRARSAPAFAGERVWIHSDLLRPNVLVRDGRLRAVLDFGAVGVGDPAADVIPAWTVFGPGGRAAYREILDVDDGTWERARGYALTQAVLIVPYYRDSNPPFTASALRTIREVLSDLDASQTCEPDEGPGVTPHAGRPPESLSGGGVPNRRLFPPQQAITAALRCPASPAAPGAPGPRAGAHTIRRCTASTSPWRRPTWTRSSPTPPTG